MEQLLKYKETEFGKLPVEWNILCFREFVDKIQSGIWGDSANDNKNAYPILRSTDISHESKIIYKTATIRKIPLEKVSDYTMNNGDILIVSSSGSPHLIGRSAIFMKPDDRTYLFSNFLIRITPSKSIVAKYLYYLLHSHFYYNALHKIQETTSGLRNLSKSQLAKMSLPVASLDEQHKIASILSKVDELIQKTDHIIDQSQRLKKGIMEKAFSARSFSKIVKIEDIKANAPNAITMGPFGSNITRDNFVPSGVPVIRGVNLTREPFNMNGFVFLTDKKADELRSANAFAGDLVFTHRGTLGQVGLIPNDSKYKRYVVSQSQMKLACDLSKVEPLYVYYYFISSKGQNALLSNIHGTGVPAIGQPTTTLKQIKIPIPPLSEQRKISNYLLTLNQLVEIHKKRKGLTENLKKGLMQKLLTGKIRVKL